jgi:hypothetical protein
MKTTFWQVDLAKRAIFWYRYPILFFYNRNRRRKQMDHSFPRACEACGQEIGVGFKDGQWHCDTCLGKPDASDGQGKPSPSRRIFITAQATSLLRSIADSISRSPPLGDQAAQAVISDLKTRFQKKSREREGNRAGQAKPSIQTVSSGKESRRKKQSSRSQRFSNRRKS